MLHLHHRLIGLRGEYAALRGRGYEPAWGDEELLSYYRAGDGLRFFIAANFSNKMKSASFDGAGLVVVSTTSMDRGAVDTVVELEPNEAVLIQLS